MPGASGSGLRETLRVNRGSSIGRYKRLVLGGGGLGALLNFEIRLLLCENTPGALGIVLRRMLYRPLFAKMGRNVILGKGITIRRPSKIALGDNVAIDDYCSLDVRGGEEAGISIGDDTIISRNTILRAKDGRISIGRGCGIGSNCILAASGTLDIGESTLMGSCVCVIAGGEHAFDRLDLPISLQGMIPKGGVAIGRNAWLGTRVTVLDGAHIGDGAVIGACALVNKDVPARCVAYGIPARPVRERGQGPS